mmetsp:Transcript_25886/g.55370  ORF Transcript_25886/g.55370 Transcript_25886/m.55370 type:complete len:240 (-) Transcript_25886:402-1121(-)
MIETFLHRGCALWQEFLLCFISNPIARDPGGSQFPETRSSPVVFPRKALVVRRHPQGCIQMVWSFRDSPSLRTLLRRNVFHDARRLQVFGANKFRVQEHVRDSSQGRNKNKRGAAIADRRVLDQFFAPSTKGSASAQTKEDSQNGVQRTPDDVGCDFRFGFLFLGGFVLRGRTPRIGFAARLRIGKSRRTRCLIARCRRVVFLCRGSLRFVLSPVATHCAMVFCVDQRRRWYAIRLCVV